MGRTAGTVGFRDGVCEKSVVLGLEMIWKRGTIVKVNTQ
jgi:hypothetical protein